MVAWHLVIQKTTGQSKSPGLAKAFSTNNQTRSGSKTRFSCQERSLRSQELREHIDLQVSQMVSHDKFFSHEEVIQAGNFSKLA